MQLHAEAYQINTNNLSEPWNACEDVYYESRGNAKLRALADNEGLETTSGETLSFLNIRVKRAPKYDQYIVDGKIMTKSQIEYKQRRDKRDKDLDELLAANPNAKAYIRKGGTYWGPNNCGYTERKEHAGIYDIEDAVSTVKSGDLGRYESVEVIDVEKHNEMINKKIEKLQANLIT